jgi:carbohydrate-selective porin OprB
VARTVSLRFAIPCLGCLLAASYLADGQQTTGANQASTQTPSTQTPSTQTASTQSASTQPVSTQSKFNCPHPADPRRRQHDCNDHEFTLDETLAGGWNNVRREMQRIGLTPTASYVGALQTNVTGGPHQVWSYAGLLSFAVSADLGELIKIPGLSAYVGTSWGTGSNLADSLDSTIPTSSLYAPSFYLGEMYLQQRLLRSKLTILGGRIAAGNAFAALPVFTNYVNYGINPNPFSLGANDVTFFGPPPGTGWGAQASYAVMPTIQVAAGVFNTNVNSANGENHGADFALQEGNKGVLAIAELDYLRNQKTNSVGKPGQITVGFLHNNNSFPYLNHPLNHSDGYNGAYLMGQQMVFRPDGPGTSRGATLWGAWTFNSRDIVSPIPLFWGAGVSYEGLVPKRKNDIVSACLIRAESSKYVLPSNTEQVLELNYQWSHSRYLTITPHGEYLWKQNNAEGRNATVLGIQLALTL